MHVFILCHGVGGSATDLEYLARQLHKQGSRSDLDSIDSLIVTYSCSANSGWGQTLDGVDLGGDRVLSEIRGILQNPHFLNHHPSIASLNKPHLKISQHGTMRPLPFDDPARSQSSLDLNARSLNADEMLKAMDSSLTSDSAMRLSFVGHSCGGIYLRYALAKANEQKIIHPSWILSHFATLATPHLGLQTIWAPLAGRCLGGTIGHLCMQDADEGSCLLAKMATDPSAVEVLSKFRYRWLVADYAYDLRVPCNSAMILHPIESELNQFNGSVMRDPRRIVSVSPSPQLASAALKSTSKFKDTKSLMAESLLSMQWWRIYVSFRPFVAHEDLAVCHPKLHSIGRPFIAWLGSALMGNDHSIESQMRFMEDSFRSNNPPPSQQPHLQSKL